jgi:hypothetical protein
MKRILSLIIAATLVSPASAQTPTPATAPAQQAEALYRQGQAAEKAGDPIAAQKAYNEALKANPNHANARYSLGQLKLSAPAIAAKGREAKFGAVVIPAFNLDEATLQEALDALSVIIQKQSKDTVSPNFVIQDPTKQLAAAKISLKLKSMPAKAVLQYLLESAGAKARYDEHAVVIMPVPK